MTSSKKPKNEFSQAVENKAWAKRLIKKLLPLLQEKGNILRMNSTYFMVCGGTAPIIFNYIHPDFKDDVTNALKELNYL